MAVLSDESPGIQSIINRSNLKRHKESLGNNTKEKISVIDHRLAGADWLLPPAPPEEGPKRFVFASIKGGVGRTTALAVAAVNAASKGEKVLVVDLDLEAPGIGSILLAENELPKYGMLDAYIEHDMGNISSDFYFELFSPSSFGGGRGLIDVAPALGKTSLGYPQNVLAKLSRAYIESETDSGEILSFTQKTHLIIHALSLNKTYDKILIDARAGLNESTAAALLGLGANIFFFGEDTPQTFSGYRYLLSHLARFSRDSQDDWVARTKIIHAKASPTQEAQQRFRDRAFDIFREFIYREIPLDANSISSESILEYSIDQQEAPHFAIPILRDSNYFEFDPHTASQQLREEVYGHTYEHFLRAFSTSNSTPDHGE